MTTVSSQSAGTDPDYKSGPNASEQFTPDQLPCYQDYVQENTVGEVFSSWAQERKGDFGTKEIPIARYRSTRELHELEVKRVWRHTWQFACLVDDIPEVGDHFVYEIADYSIVVVRSGDDKLSAFHNACLHRGAALCTEAGNSPAFFCPFHGWRYDLDGTLMALPSHWDFPDTKPGLDRLHRVQVASYYGMVWINMDLEAPPLSDYLAPLAEHLTAWPGMDRRSRTAWVSKIMPVNWKAAMDAFMEGYHFAATHPESCDASQTYEMQYDILGEHISRVLIGGLCRNGRTGPDTTEQELMDLWTSIGQMPRIELPDGATARSHGAVIARGLFEQHYGIDLQHVSDAEILDATLVYVFPNTVIWGHYGFPWIYRFRPAGEDSNSCLMEVFQLAMCPEDKPRSHVPLRALSEDEPFAVAAELGRFGPVLDQDVENMQRQRVGVRSTPATGFRFAGYQESLIRHHQHVLDQYLGPDRPQLTNGRRA